MTQPATLTDAIEWARDRWANQRAVPTRLHTREEEGIGLGFTPAFRTALDGKPDTVIDQTRTVDCHHPLLPRGHAERDCPECNGHRVKEVRSDLYAYPMTLALHRLRNGLASRRHPHPYGLVIVLASHGWLPRQAARALELPWERAEPLFLMALRRLHSHYAEGPVRTSRSTVERVTSWVDLSDSQRAAIEAGETAA